MMLRTDAAAYVIALDFLQTVVIVDDQAELRLTASGDPVPVTRDDPTGGPSASNSAAADTRLEVADAAEGLDSEPSPDLVEPSGDALSVAEHGVLDAKTIINDFAHLGLVCGVIRPERDEDIGPIVNSAARRADVLVLDWWMHGDAGAMSKAIITQVAARGDQQDRIRLIVIYTAAQDLEGVAAEIAASLEGEVLSEQRNRVLAGSIRVVVLAKPDTNVDPSLADAVVPFDAFPGRVVREFASTVEGLLSNVAFAALAAVRGNTHRVLSRFDRALDPAFLGHRMLLQDPEDAERHLVELILQEFSAVLESAAVGKNADYGAIQRMVSDSVLAVDDVWRLSDFAKRIDVSIADLAMLFIKEGVGSPSCKLSGKERKDIRSWASRIFALDSDGTDPVRADVAQEWSMLMSNKLQYSDNRPTLSLGVVVRDVSTGAFMLCMQPACDSVRLAGRTSFPFLPLEKASDGSDIVLKYSGSYHLLNVRIRLRDLVVIPFNPSGDAAGAVKADRQTEDGSWHFVPTTEDGAPLECVTELRDSFAHKFANRFAESASRVGTDDSELFRRGAL